MPPPTLQEELSRFRQMIGFDPNKVNVTKDVVDNVLQKIAKENDEKAAKRAEEMIRQGMEIDIKVTKLMKETDKELAKYYAGLGKVMNWLRSIRQGQQPAEETANNEQPPSPAGPSERPPGEPGVP